MNRFALVLDRAGRPVSPEDLHPLRAAMSVGPWQAVSTDASGPVGFIDVRPAGRTPPASFGDGPLLLASARIDDRETLARELRGAGVTPPDDGSPEALLLAAYRAWGGEACAHLLGDFAFAIWDPASRRLVAARDQLGVRSLYHAEVDGRVVVTNMLAAVRALPGLDRGLNEAAICDFLMFGMQLDLSSTAFAGIQRLAPGHRLVAEGDAPVRVHRYWALPVEEPLRLRRGSDYVDAYTERLHAAVADRLVAGGTGVSLSGGLDSSAVLAVASAKTRGGPEPYDLRAWTVDSPELWPDGGEAGLAAEVADLCDTPHDVVRPEDFPVFFEPGAGGTATPVPLFSTQHGVFLRQFRAIAQHASVALTGNGSDPALLPDCAYLGRLLARGRVLRSAMDFGRFVWRRRRVPPLCLRSFVTPRLTGKSPERPPFPPWLDEDLVVRLRLRERWDEQLGRFFAPGREDHPDRPQAHAAVTSPHWPFVFWSMSPEVSGLPLAVAHPFFDLRVVSYALRLPSVPWCVDKWILREAMRNRLPERVRQRFKTTPRLDPSMNLVRRSRGGFTGALEWSTLRGTEVGRYLRLGVLENLVRQLPRLRGQELPLVGRPLTLIQWMDGALPTREPHSFP